MASSKQIQTGFRTNPDLSEDGAELGHHVLVLVGDNLLVQGAEILHLGEEEERRRRIGEEEKERGGEDAEEERMRRRG